MEWHTWRADGVADDNSPAVTQYGYDGLEDAPHLHWWRAYWSEPGISLRAYPVIRKTPTGVWIAHHAWYGLHPDRSGSWQGLQAVRWMSSTGKASWAKPTREVAVYSLAVRLTRWTKCIRDDFERAQRCCEALAAARPDLADFAKTATKNLNEPRQSEYLLLGDGPFGESDLL